MKIAYYKERRSNYMSSRHPQNKKDLEKLKLAVEEQLQKIGTSNANARQIANILGVDSGLVIKFRNEINYRKRIQTINPVIKNDLPVIITKEEDMKLKNENNESVISSDIETHKDRKKRVELTEDQAYELYCSYKSKEFNKKELIELYNVSISTVNRIINRYASAEKEGKEESNMGKRRKTMTRNRQRNNKNNAAKKTVNTNNQQIVDGTYIPEDDRLYPEEGGKNPDEPFATIRFVAYLPLNNYEKESRDSNNIIWAISKNADYHDLFTDINIMKKSDGNIINTYRDRYYLVSIVNGGIIHLIDYWDVTNETLSTYTSQEKYKIKDEDGNFITYDEFNKIIKSIIKYDSTTSRSRLRLNDFVFDNNRFTDLHKIFGLDEFSFNLASKNNAITVEAGLIADRHDGMPVDKFIYEASFGEELMFDYNEQERIAKKFLNDNFDFTDSSTIKQLKLYVTGMQSAYGAVMKSCIEMGVHLVSMHYNAKTKSYIPQYVNGNPEDCGAYIKAFEKLHNQKSLNSDILLFNCTYEDFTESNVDTFYIMECAKMRNQSSTDNQKAESIIIIIKNRQDIWKLYPRIVDHIIDNDGLNLAMWVTDGKIKDNNLCWGMNIVKSFNYK